MEQKALDYIKEKLEGTKKVGNVNFVLRNFGEYKEVPCLEFNLVSEGYDTEVCKVYAEFCKDMCFNEETNKTGIKDLVMVYDNPGGPNNTDGSRRVRVYIKNRNEQEKQRVLEQIVERFTDKLSACPDKKDEIKR